MAKRKKVFPCGHIGFGQKCHACAQAEAEAAQKAAAIAERKAVKQSWEATFAADPIDLRDLPRDIVLKAREILGQIAAGLPYGELGGKRLNHDREIISIPVTRNYRMLCRHPTGGRLTPVRVMTHEEYNGKKPRA
jgi:hypothetical protein